MGPSRGYSVSCLWGRTGFDLEDPPEAARRGWFVGLVKNRTKNQKLTKSSLSRPKATTFTAGHLLRWMNELAGKAKDGDSASFAEIFHAD